MVAYIIETRLNPQRLEWEQLIATACAAQISTGGPLSAISVTHNIASMSSDEIESVVSLAARLAGESELDLETHTDASHLTLRFCRPGNTADASEPIAIGALFKGIWHRFDLSRERHS